MRSLHIAILTLFLLLFSGCAALNKYSQPEPAKINHMLPAPKNIKTLSGMDSVAFEWNLVGDPNVDGFNIYRSSPDGGNSEYLRVGKVKDRFSTHYVDEKLTPNTQYFYQIASYDKEGNESPSTEVVKAKTDPFDPIPFAEAISNYPRKVKVIWRPYPNPKIEGYIIERNDLGSSDWKSVGRVKGRLNVEYIDDKLADNRLYKYRVIAYTFTGLKSPPSRVVEATTKPLPEIVQNIVATKELPKQIKLTWAPVSNKDLDYYNIYKAKSAEGSYSVAGKGRVSEFTDTTAKDGEEFFYKVTAVDTDGLESPMPVYPTHGMSLPQPASPIVTSATIEGKKAVIRWSRGDDRAVSYVVHRSSGSWFKKENISFDSISGTTFTDDSIAPGIEYNYSVSSVDRFGIVSEPTKNAVLLLPENLGN